jgi:hypothetical protein
MAKYLILLLSITGICLAANWVNNGDFEQPLNIGWLQEIGTSSGSDTIDRQVYYDPNPDYCALVKKYDATHAKLWQTVAVPNTNDLQFTIKANLYAFEYNTTATYWSAAAVCLRYLDQNGNLLGETRIAHRSMHCPWTGSTTLHIMDVTFPNTWQTFAFNINQELSTYLPFVNQQNIKKIEIALLDTTDGC